MEIIKICIFWLISFALYRLFISTSQAYSHRRYYLLLTLILGLCTPVLDYFIIFSTPLASITLEMNLPEMAIDSAFESRSNDYFGIRWTHILWLIYSFGFIFAIRPLLVQIVQLIRNHRSALPAGDHYCLPNNGAIYSFMGYIYIGDEVSLNSFEKQMVLSHEKAHVQRLHSYDLMLIHLLRIAFWFLPIWRWLIKEVHLLHEFEVDLEIIKNVDSNDYALLLARIAGGNLQVVHYFSHSIIKKRLKVMLVKRKKSNQVLIVGSYIFIAALFFSSACVSGSDEMITQSKKSESVHLGSADESDEEITTTPDEKPYLLECADADNKDLCLLQKLYETVKYPDEARKSGKEGMAVVSFVVDKTGGMKDISLSRSLDPALDLEVIRVAEEFKDMGNIWSPGIKNGKIVNVRYSLPIKFKLTN